MGSDRSAGGNSVRKRFMTHHRPVWDAGRSSSAAMYIAVALAAVVPRLFFSFAYPDVIGDGQVYLAVARNILDNACVSQSDPATGTCIPHWGGNQLPGYPAFVAASIWLGGWMFGDVVATGTAQSLVAALVAMRLAYALTKFLPISRVIMVAGLVLGLSAVHVPWSRLIMTESLAISLAIWLFAELLLSHAQGRLRVLPIAFVLVCSTFVRYDGILLAVPVALVGLRLHNPVAAIRRGAMITLIVAVPLAAWTARSVAVGLPVLPPVTNSTDAEDAVGPNGFFSWLRTWVGNQDELKAALWPALRLHYTAIDLPERAYLDDSERVQVASLLGRLVAHDGETIPPDIDAAFAEMAVSRRAARPWERWIATPIRRVLWMSLHPLTSVAWPQDAAVVRRIRATLARGEVAEAVRISFAHPLTPGGKLVNLFYPFLLYGLLAFVVVSRGARSAPCAGLLLQLSVSYWIARAGFFAVVLGVPESRLLVEALPGLEIAVAVGILALVGQLRADKRPG